MTSILKASFLCLIVLISPRSGGGQTFLAGQLTHEHVRIARAENEEKLRALFAEKHLAYPPRGLFLRAFKSEAKLEVWAAGSDGERLSMVKSYPICAGSGKLGPKRREGDLQVPEGFYKITLFNPESDFYLSLGINYPNASDKILSDKKRPGGNIMIHGNCVTIGCIPIQDKNIKELYWMCLQAREAGQEVIPVHVLPAVLDSAGMTKLRNDFSGDSTRIAFWENLKPGYDLFEQTHVCPMVGVDERGRYVFAKKP